MASLDLERLREFAFTEKTLPAMRSGRKYHGCGKAQVGGSQVLIVAGGRTAKEKVMTSVEMLEIGPGATADAQWLSIGRLREARSFFPAVGVIDGILVVAAGMDGHGRPTDTVEVFDEVDQRFATSKSLRLRLPRYGHSTSFVDEKHCIKDATEETRGLRGFVSRQTPIKEGFTFGRSYFPEKDEDFDDRDDDLDDDNNEDYSDEDDKFRSLFNWERAQRLKSKLASYGR